MVTVSGVHADRDHATLPLRARMAMTIALFVLSSQSEHNYNSSWPITIEYMVSAESRLTGCGSALVQIRTMMS